MRLDHSRDRKRISGRFQGDRNLAEVAVDIERDVVKGATQAAKTDKLDARTLAQLLAAGFLREVWTPDERTRALRRRIAREAHR